MPITGVMPLPPVTKRTLSGAGSGSTKSPRAWSRWTSCAGAQLLGEVQAHGAVGNGLGGDGEQAVGRLGRRGQRVGAPQPHAVDVDADPDVLAGDVPLPGAAGAQHHGDRVAGLGADLDDAGAEVRAGRSGRNMSR